MGLQEAAINTALTVGAAGFLQNGHSVCPLTSARVPVRDFISLFLITRLLGQEESNRRMKMDQAEATRIQQPNTFTYTWAAPVKRSIREAFGSCAPRSKCRWLHIFELWFPDDGRLHSNVHGPLTGD